MKKIFLGKYLSAATALCLCFHFLAVFSQEKGSLQGQIKLSEGQPLNKGRVFLLYGSADTSLKKPIDSTMTDSTGNFIFKNFALGNYSIGLNISGVNDTIADNIPINELNPNKHNQHFYVNDGSLVCLESNYISIKDALSNPENIFSLDLVSLQHDVAEESLTMGTDGSIKLSTQIGVFVNLESLSIDINQINSLPAEIGNLSKLTTLTASLNKLSFVPNEMENLKNLRSLNIGKNNFTSFPELITKYSVLETLNIEGNPFTTIPATINGLKSLKVLNLSNCSELTNLPAQIGELAGLEMLNLSRCTNLKSLPEELQKLQSLKVLDVTGTKISVKDFQKAVPGCEVRK